MWTIGGDRWPASPRRPNRYGNTGSGIEKARLIGRAFAQVNESLIAQSAASSGGLVLDHGLILRLGRTATRALGERRFDFLDRFGLGHVLHR